MLSGADGALDDAARSKLRLLAVPSYLVALAIIGRHPSEVWCTMSRNMAFTMMIVLPLASVAWSISPSITLRRAIGLGLSMLLAYALASRFTSKQLLLLVGAVLGAAMVLSLLFFVVAPDMATMMEENALRGVFLHKNVLGWYAALSALVGWCIASDRALGLRRRGLVLLGISTLCLLMSQSMTGMLTWASALILVLFYRALARRRSLQRIILVCIFLQVVILISFVLSQFLGPVLEALGKDSTLTGRIPLWAQVDARIATRPFFGYGYQAFWTPGNVEAWQIWGEAGWMAPHSHNGLRETLLSLGALGAAILILVIARGLIHGASLHCRAPGEGWLWLNAYLGSFLVMNLTEAVYFSQNDFLFVIFATALLMISRHARRIAPTREARKPSRPT